LAAIERATCTPTRETHKSGCIIEALDLNEMKTKFHNDKEHKNHRNKSHKAKPQKMKKSSKVLSVQKHTV
jgi:hypothetical protein